MHPTDHFDPIAVTEIFLIKESCILIVMRYHFGFMLAFILVDSKQNVTIKCFQKNIKKLPKLSYLLTNKKSVKTNNKMVSRKKVKD